MNPYPEKLAVRNLRVFFTVDELETMVQYLEPLAGNDKDVELLLQEIYNQLHQQGVHVARDSQ